MAEGGLEAGRGQDDCGGVFIDAVLVVEPGEELQAYLNLPRFHIDPLRLQRFALPASGYTGGHNAEPLGEQERK